MQRIAFLVQAHADPVHFNRLVERLTPHRVFAHIDKKVSQLHSWNNSKVRFVEPRYNVVWAGYTQVQATLSLLRAALSSGEHYTKLVLLSGSCYPIKPLATLSQLFESDSGFNYIKYVDMRDSDHLITLINKRHFRRSFLSNTAAFKSRHFLTIDKAIARSAEQITRWSPSKWPFEAAPYHGSNWWALSPEAAKFCIERIEQNKEIERFYSGTFASDEQVFHTIIGNSAYREMSSGEFPFTGRGTYKAANLHIVHPSLTKWYTSADFGEIESSDKYFVRKVSTQLSDSLLNLIDQKLLA